MVLTLILASFLPIIVFGTTPQGQKLCGCVFHGAVNAALGSHFKLLDQQPIHLVCGLGY